MFRTLIAGVVALIAVAQPGAALAQSASALSGFVRDSSGAPVPGALVRVIAESAGTTVEKVSDEQGAYRAEALSSGRYRVETVLEGFETTVRRVALEPGQAAALDLTLTPVTPQRGRRRHRPSRRRDRSGGADSGVCRERRARRDCRRLQCQSRQGSDPDGAVLFDEPAQLRHQYPRPRCAVRPHERWHRGRRRPLRRRRVLRAPGGGNPGLPRPRTHRSPARTARDAVRQEHDRRCHQRDDAAAVLHAAERLRVELRQSRLRPGERLGHGRSLQQGRRARFVLGHAARRHRLQRGDARRGQRLEQRRRSRPVADCAVRQSSRSTRPSITRGSGPTATRRSSPASRRRSGQRTGSTRRLPPISATRRQASMPSTA